MPQRRQIQNRQKSPNGTPDPSVFSAEHNREGIQVGRPLTANEALECTKPVRRIAALLARHPLLDAHYECNHRCHCLRQSVSGLEGWRGRVSLRVQSVNTHELSKNTSQVAAFTQMKKRGEKIAMLTAYDYPTARLLDESGADILLVGDSLGMVVLGYPDTTFVTMDEMVHHTRAVARADTKAPVLADLPIGTCDTPEAAVENARRLIDAGAAAVKIEGGASHAPQVAALVAAGIPAMAHIGMMPQRVRIEGGYRVKGKTPEDAERLLADARAAEEAGAFGLLLELVQTDTARLITESVRIPTIGIGSGLHCDGQVLVTPDLIGSFPWFTPRFVTQRAKVADEIRRAVSEYVAEVKQPRG